MSLFCPARSVICHLRASSDDWQRFTSPCILGKHGGTCTTDAERRADGCWWSSAEVRRCTPTGTVPVGGASRPGLSADNRWTAMGKVLVDV
jgi:hypothetical protein